MPTTAGPGAANTVSQTPAASPGHPTSSDDFFAKVLRNLGAPVTTGNLIFLEGWARTAENTKALNNPLATTWPAPGATVFNTLPGGGHVWNYATPETGAWATAQTLKAYPGIVSILGTGSANQRVSGNTQVYKDLNYWVNGGNHQDASHSQYVSNVLSGVSGFVTPGQDAATPGVFGSGTIKGALPAIGKDTGITGAASAVGDAAGSAAGAVKSTGEFLGKLSDPQLWLRIVEIAAGAALIGMGLYLILKDFGITAPKPPGPLGKGTDSAEATADELASAFSQGERQGQVAAARQAGRQSVPRVNRATTASTEPLQAKSARLRAESSAFGDTVPF